MSQKEFLKEFKNNIVERSEKDGLGLTVNSVGVKSITNADNVNCTESVKKFQFKKGVIRNEFKLIYITKGNGIISLNSQNIEISEGQIIFIYPQQSYEYCHTTKDWNEYYIRFEADDYYYQFIKETFKYNGNVIDLGYNAEIVTLFTRTIEVVQNGLNSTQTYLSGMLIHVLGLIIAVSSLYSEKDIYLQKIDHAKVIMYESIFDDISIPEIADKLNMSYSLFRRLFKKEIGISPAKYFNEIKLNKAKQLLLETTLSIKEIAYMINKNNPEHFFTLFKKNIGETPSTYRLTAGNTSSKSI